MKLVPVPGLECSTSLGESVQQFVPDASDQDKMLSGTPNHVPIALLDLSIQSCHHVSCTEMYQLHRFRSDLVSLQSVLVIENVHTNYTYVNFEILEALSTHS
jgi:hypothetical protein